MPPRLDPFRFRQKTARVRAPLLRAAERGYTLARPLVDAAAGERRKLFLNHRGVYPVVGFNGRAAGCVKPLADSRIWRGDRIVSAESLLNARADFNALLSLNWRNRGSELEAAERKSVGGRTLRNSYRRVPIRLKFRRECRIMTESAARCG